MGPQRSRTLSVTLVVALLAPAILVFMTGTAPLASASPGPENWWNSSWVRRRPITISNTGSALADYQISVTVDTASLISAGKMQASGADIRFFDNRWKYSMPITINSGSALTDYQVLVTVNTQTPISQTKMQASGADIRFKDTDNRTDLYYWIETGINTTSTKIWVKVPSVPNGSKTIYMYYGNPSASSASNESMTFIRVIDNGGSPVKGSWSMDEGTGSTTKDNSGIGNDVTMSGTTWTSGKPGFGNANNFDGNDYDYKNTVTLPTGSVATAEAWIYPRSYADATYNGIVVWGGRGTNNTFALAIQSTGRPSFAAFGNDFVPTSGPSATLNAWNHIVAVLNGTSITLYMNGQSVSGTLGSTPAITSTNLRIGCLDLAGRYFNGIIDEVRIYNRALNAGEILDIYNNYGYVTPNYLGKVLVRKYASTEPITSVGAEVAVDGFELSHWIENGINTTATKIWVRVPSILASPNTSTIYMYYGNPSATSASNESTTFIFFAGNQTGGSFSTDMRNSNGFIIEAAVTPTVLQTEGPEINFDVTGNGSEATHTDYYKAGGGTGQVRRFDTNSAGTASNFQTWGYIWPLNTKKLWKIVVKDTNFQFYFDGVLRHSAANLPYPRGIMNFGGWSTGDSGIFNWVVVRKYASTEPIASVGSEDRGPKPTLVSPDNGIATDDSTPTFTWEGGAVDHRLLVDDDDTFASPNENRIITSPTTTYTYTIPDGDSLADGIYYWKVVAMVAGDNESGVRWFRVAATSPTTPYLISPESDSVTDQATLTFAWSSVSGTKQYELFVDNDNDFSSTSVKENVSGASSVKTLTGETYYWKVRAWNWVEVPGDWSETWKFTMESFTLSTVDQIMIARGTDKLVAVSVQLTLGVPSTVSLSGAWIGTPPSGVTPSFSPAIETMTFYSTLTFSTIGSATIGTFTYRITATSANGIVRTSDVEVSITTMVFSFDVSPSTILLMRSDEATLDVSVVFEEGEEGNKENVLLSGSWIGSTPGGVSASFAPTSGVPTFSSVLSFTTTYAADNGSFTYRAKGTAEGGVAATVDVIVNISTAITITMATDNASYEKMQIITISGTAMDPEGDLVGSGTATISIVSGAWSRTFPSTITDGVYSFGYFIALDNPEGTWTISVSAVDSYGNATYAPVSVDVTVVYSAEYRYYVVTFLSPIDGQFFSRGQAVAVTVKITENNNNLSGANVVLEVRLGTRVDNVDLTESSFGIYSAAYTLPLDAPTGSLDMMVIGEKAEGGVFKAGVKSTSINTTPATLVLRLTSPTKREFEAGETVKVEVRASYSDGSSVDEGIIVVNRPRGDNLQLTAEWGGVYGATYIIDDDEVGTWDIRISAVDAYGNSGSVEAPPIVIVERGLASYVIRYWPVVLAAILGLVVASAFAAHGHMRTRRIGAIKREKQEIEKLKKEVAVNYFKKGSISRETYDNLTKEYATKLTNLDKEERILSDKMKKKKLSEKKHPRKKGR